MSEIEIDSRMMSELVLLCQLCEINEVDFNPVKQYYFGYSMVKPFEAYAETIIYIDQRTKLNQKHEEENL